MQLGLNCRDCDQQLKKERGCGTAGILAWHIGQEIIRQCPLSIIDTQTWQYISAYTLYKKNLLPQGKGWLNESQKFIDAMAVLDGEVARIEKEQSEKARKKAHGRPKIKYPNRGHR